jgi:hypothetical protein
LGQPWGFALPAHLIFAHWMTPTRPWHLWPPVNAVEAAVVEREGSPWPEGLLSVSYFVSFDGEKVLTYAQWASEDAASGLDGPEPIIYRLYRSGVSDGETRVPGCIVSETVPHPGGISADFHLSVDGKRVLNYASWTDAEAHRRAIGDPGAPGVARSLSPQWHTVQNTPGVTPLGFKRYRLDSSVAVPLV